MSPFDAVAFVDEPSREQLDELRERAAPALAHPRPLELFAESCRAMGLGGNLALASTIYLSATTRVLAQRKRLHAHVFVLGPASSGKSFETDAALEHLPPGGVERFEGCSPRALIYGDREIRHRVLFYSEMDSLPLNGEDDASNAALSYLRTLVVNGSATYEVVVKSKGGFETKRFTKEGPATLIVTGTRRLPDEQLASRLHEVEVLVDRVRLRSVVGAQGRLLRGSKTLGPSESIVAAQGCLQALAPLDVSIPFAEALGRAILERAKVTDPRLTREFPRIAGFTAAHALLCIERRERDGDGAVIATLEDYEAASGVIKELSTVREFSRFAIEVWEQIKVIYENTKLPVTVAQVSKELLKDQSGVRKTFNLLLAGGALLDAREHPSRTTPHLVTPTSDHPCRILLPTAEELAAHGGERYPERHQSSTAQAITSGSRVERSGSRGSSLSGHDLTQLGTPGTGGMAPEAVPNVYPEAPKDDPADGAVYRHDGVDYRVGDVLPDGKWVIEVHGGIGILSRRPPGAAS